MFLDMIETDTSDKCSAKCRFYFDTPFSTMKWIECFVSCYISKQKQKKPDEFKLFNMHKTCTNYNETKNIELISDTMKHFFLIFMKSWESISQNYYPFQNAFESQIHTIDVNNKIRSIYGLYQIKSVEESTFDRLKNGRIANWKVEEWYVPAI